MPLPQFLLVLAAVIAMAGLTIWAALSVGLSPLLLGLLALVAVAVLHYTRRESGDQRHGKHH